MASSNTPAEPPPSYDSIAGSSSRPNQAGSSHLQVPNASNDRNGIPASHRRSMEDEHRPLPKGWVRSFDPESSHQFYVNTTTDPPTSIWTHPYDDPTYLKTLSSEERERIEEQSLRHPPDSIPTKADIISDHTDNEHSDTELPPRPKKDGQGPASGSGEKPSFGRKMKDKLTGTTHEERERERARRAEEERRLYQQHLQIRKAMLKASETGQPQLIGKDRNGKDVYIEPPPRGGYGGGYGGGYPGGGYGYSPYSSGMYAAPGMYSRPAYPYGRPYGGGFGGGMGLPLMMGGGLMGGLLLGDALGGF